LASPITCDSTHFIVSATLGATQLSAPVCSTNGANTTFTFATSPNQPLPLTGTETVDMTLTIVAAAANVIFTPILQYAISGLVYDKSITTINETIVGSSSTLITGTTNVAIAAVAAEQIDINNYVLATGYTFSYISTTPTVASAPSTILQLVFTIDVPAYYVQVRQVQNISGLSFVSGILAIGGGVLAGGTLFAFFWSYIAHHWFKYREDDENTTKSTTELQWREVQY
jgi:hypothetical protein